MTNKKAFTIIEMIFTIIIILIFFNVILLKYNNSDYKKINEDANQFINDVKYIQRLSLAENKSFKIQVDNNTNKYIIYTNGEPEIKKFLNNSTIGYETNNNNSIFIKYSSTGTISTGQMTYDLKNGKYSLIITVIPSTGRIKIKNVLF